MMQQHRVMEFPDGISEEEFNEIVSKGGKVLLDVYTSWCMPCKRVKPIFQELSLEYNDIEFVSLDLDYTKWIGEKYDIHAIPTFLFFKNGKMIYKQLGGMEKSEFVSLIKSKF